MKAQRPLTAALVMTLVGLGVAYVTGLVEHGWRHFVDSALYILTAKSLAAGDGYSYLGQPFFVRPPGMSFLLTPFVSEPYDFRTMNLLVNATAVGTVAAVALVMRRLHGPILGLVVALLFAVNPLTLGGLNKILSEFPSMMLLFGGAWLVLPTADGRQPGWAKALGGALLLGASLWMRSAGLLLLPALVLGDLLRRDGRRYQGAVVALVSLGLFLPWMLHAGDAASKAERPSTQLLMFDYKTALFRTNPSDPQSELVDLSGWIERLESNTREIGAALGHSLAGIATERDPEDNPNRGKPKSEQEDLPIGPVPATVSIVAALAMVATLLLRRSQLDLFMAAYAVLLLLYFTFVDRLLLPIVPLVLSSLVDSAQRLSRWLAEKLEVERLAVALPALVCVALGVVSVMAAPEALEPGRKKKAFYSHDRRTATWVNENLPQKATLLHEKGAVMTLLTGRTTYTYRNLPGMWPEGCPKVDYAIFGPRPPREERADVELAVNEEAFNVTPVPCKWFKEDSWIRIYHMTRDSPRDGLKSVPKRAARSGAKKDKNKKDR